MHLTYARNYAANFPLARLQRNTDFAIIPSQFQRLFDATSLSRSSKINQNHSDDYEYWSSIFLRSHADAAPDVFSDAGLDVFKGEQIAGALRFNREILVNASYYPIRLCGRQIELRDGVDQNLLVCPRRVLDLGVLRDSILARVRERIQTALGGEDESNLRYSLLSKKPSLFLKAEIGGVAFGSECGKRKNSYIFVDNPETFAKLDYATNGLKSIPYRSTLLELYPNRLMPAKIFAFVNIPIGSRHGAGCIRFALVRYLQPASVYALNDFTIPCIDETQQLRGGFKNERSLDGYALIPITSIFCRCVGYPTYNVANGEKRINLTPLMFGC